MTLGAQGLEGNLQLENNNNNQKVVVMENHGTFLDPSTLSAVVNTNDENGITFPEDIHDDSEIDNFTDVHMPSAVEYINASDIIKVGNSNFTLTADEEHVFNVTDSVTVQDAYLASVKMGHFNGMEEHAYFITHTPEISPKQSQTASHLTLVKTPECGRRRASHESPNMSPSVKSRLSTGSNGTDSPKYKRSLSLGSVKSPSSYFLNRYDTEEEIVMHGSDSEGREIKLNFDHFLITIDVCTL